MNYDIRTPDLAYETFYELMLYKKSEVIDDVFWECNNDFNVFIEKNMDYIKSLDIN